MAVAGTHAAGRGEEVEGLRVERMGKRYHQCT